MNLGNDPADQIVRYTLEGTEIALKLSGLAAKNFALFVYAVLKDQKKTHGKTRLVRMLREQRPFKFFKIPSELMREFAKEAKGHGLLYVPIRNKRDRQMIEIVAFADDAAKIQRIYDNLGLDYVKAQIGEAAVVEKAPVQEMKNQEVSAPAKTETVQTEQGAAEFEIGGLEDDFNIGFVRQDESENFISGREKESAPPAAEKNLSESSSPGRGLSPDGENHREPERKPSVKKELQEIKKEQEKKKEEKTKRQDRGHPAPGRSRRKKKKAKGR